MVEGRFDRLFYSIFVIGTSVTLSDEVLCDLSPFTTSTRATIGVWYLTVLRLLTWASVQLTMSLYSYDKHDIQSHGLSISKKIYRST